MKSALKPSDANDLYCNGRAGPITLQHLIRMEHLQKQAQAHAQSQGDAAAVAAAAAAASAFTFPSISELAGAIKTGHLVELERRKADRTAVATFLASPDNGLLQPLDAKAATTLADRLFDEAHMGAATITYLKGLSDSQRSAQAGSDGKSAAPKFPSADQLIAAAKRTTDEKLAALRAYAGSADSASQLLAGRTNAKALTPSEVLQLYEESMAGPETVDVVRRLDHDRQSFETFEAALIASQFAYQQMLKEREIAATAAAGAGASAADIAAGAGDGAKAATAGAAIDETKRDADRQQLLQFLVGEECSLFSEAPNMDVAPHEVDACIDAAHSVAAAIIHCQRLDEDGSKFDSFPQLTAAVAKAAAQAIADKAAIREFIQAHPDRLFSESQPASVSSEAEVDRLYVESGAGSHTLSHLNALISPITGKPSANMNELIANVKALHAARAARLAELRAANRAAVVEFLDTSRLFSDVKTQLAVEEADLDLLLHEGGSLAGSIGYMSLLDTQSTSRLFSIVTGSFDYHLTLLLC